MPWKEYATHPALPFRYQLAPENLGCGPGTQFRPAFSGADPVLLDDDAVLQGADSLRQVIQAFEEKPDLPGY